MKLTNFSLTMTLLLASGEAMAQWTPPVPSATCEMATDGTEQYLYNTEAGGFFAGANDWGTRASINEKGDLIKVIPTEDEMYNLACYPSTKEQWLYVSCNNFDAMWVDAPNQTGNQEYPNTDMWMFEKNASGTYTITNWGIDPSFPFGMSESYNGVSGNTRLFLYDPEATYVANDEEMPSFAGKFYSEWVFIDSEEYQILQPKVETYMVSQRLKAAVDNVKATDPQYDASGLMAVYGNTSSTTEEMEGAIEVTNALMSFYRAYQKNTEAYPSLDFSAQKAVYDNPASLLSDIEAAEKGMLTVISNFLGAQASFDNPKEFTDLISDSNSDNIWTQTFTSEGKTGDKAFNTWSTEAENGGDGTDMLKPFCQVWTGSGGLLSNQRVHQTMPSMPAGLYEFKANVRAYNEAQHIDSFDGAYMFLGSDTINLQDDISVTYSGSKSVLWSNNYTVIAIVNEPGDIDLGFEFKNPNFNWIAWKQTSLTYYGNDDVVANAIKVYKASNDFPEADEFDATAALIGDYKAALGAYNSAATLAEAKEAAKSTKAALAALKANADAYATLLGKIEYWNQMVSEKDDLSGEYWEAFSDFVSFSEPVDGYPAPTAAAIAEGDRSLSTEEINEYITTVDELYSYAVTHSLNDGSDCTDMLANPSFADGFNGWTKENGNVGGLDICKNVEVFENTVKIEQTVNDVPNGIYSLSCQAFERPTWPGNITGDEDAKVFLFMNEFQTPVMNIAKDIVTTDQAENKVNCFIDNGTNSIGEWPLDSPFDNGEISGYMPNSMDGASYYFATGHYTQKVYGFVDNGVMRIGLTSNGQKIHWTLWANFRLTYEGRNEEALDAVLPDFLAQYKDFIEMNELTTPVRENVDNTLANAEKLIAAGGGENKYEALRSLNASLKDAKENAALVIEFVDAYVAALEKYETASEEGKAIFDTEAEAFNNYDKLTTEELRSLLDKLNKLSQALLPTSGEEELATPEADKAIVTGICYTAGEFGEFTNSRNGDGYLKVRTGQNGETITFNVKEGYVITGVSIKAYSNNSSSWADRSITMTGIYVDNAETSALEAPHVFNGGMAGQEPTLCEVTGIEAYKNIVLAFDNSNIVDSNTDSAGKNKQLQAIITFTFERPVSIKDNLAVPAKTTETLYLISGQQTKSAAAGKVFIQNGKKYLAPKQ